MISLVSAVTKLPSQISPEVFLVSPLTSVFRRLLARCLLHVELCAANRHITAIAPRLPMSLVLLFQFHGACADNGLTYCPINKSITCARILSISVQSTLRDVLYPDGLIRYIDLSQTTVQCDTTLDQPEAVRLPTSARTTPTSCPSAVVTT